MRVEEKSQEEKIAPKFLRDYATLLPTEQVDIVDKLRSKRKKKRLKRS